MGTNYYARIIPSKSQIKNLHELIDSNNFKRIRESIEEIYGSFRPYNMNDKPTGVIHLGKRSGGWKFLWNPNIYQIRNGHMEEVEPGHFKFVPDPDTPYYTYPLSKKGIEDFINREDVEIWDECNEKQDKNEFFNMALNWTTWKGKEAWDSDSYHLSNPNEKTWSCKNEYTNFLENLGYKLSKDKSDFYSDGLRFSTSTDFC